FPVSGPVLAARQVREPRSRFATPEGESLPSTSATSPSTHRPTVGGTFRFFNSSLENARSFDRQKGAFSLPDDSGSSLGPRVPMPASRVILPPETTCAAALFAGGRAACVSRTRTARAARSLIGG